MDDVFDDRAVLPATHSSPVPTSRSLIGSRSTDAVHQLSDTHATGTPVACVATVKRCGSVGSVWSDLHTPVLCPAPVHSTSAGDVMITCSGRQSHHNCLSLSPNMFSSPSSRVLQPLNPRTTPSSQIDSTRDQAAVTSVVPHHSLGPSLFTRPSPVEPDTHANAASFKCAICLDQVSDSDLMVLSQCHCRFCKHCVETYVTSCLRDGDSLVACPSVNCEQSGHLTSHEVQVAISHDTQLQQLYRRISYIREVDDDPRRVWCPRADCFTACAVSSDDAATFVCPCCQQWWCVQCRAPRDPTQPHECRPHESAITCDTHTARAKIKACPVCSVLIERHQGCAVMRCSRCHHRFCWYCLQPLEGYFCMRHLFSGLDREPLGHSRGWQRALRAVVVGLVLVLAVYALSVLILFLFKMLYCLCVSNVWCQCD